MARKKKFKDPYRLSLLVDKEQRDRVERHRWQQSKSEGRNIPLTEFIRRMIDLYCPGENMEMNF